MQFSLTSLFLYLHVLGPGYDLLKASFSEGDFRSFSKKSTKTATATSVPVLTSVAEEPCVDVSAIDSGQAAGVYSCPQEGCVRVFQRLSALERHLSLEKCTQSLERLSVMDLAKMGYKFRLEQGGDANLKLPMLQRVCEDLGLGIPHPPIRRKAPYLVLLEDITNKCTCRK